MGKMQKEGSINLRFYQHYRMAYSNPPKARSEPRGTGSREGGSRWTISKPFLIEIDIFTDVLILKLGPKTDE